MVLTAAAELIDIRHDADFPTSVLAIIHSVIPCDIISYNEVDFATGDANAAVFPLRWNSQMGRLMPTFERVVHHHPIASHIDATGCRTALRFEDVISEQELFDNPFYVDFLHGLMGLRHQLVLALPSPAWLSFGVALSRGPGHRFTDREVTLLDALGPHIVHNYRRFELERSQVSLAHAAAEEGWAAVSVDSDGTVLKVDGDAGPDYEAGQRVPEHVRPLFREPHRESRRRDGSLSMAGHAGRGSIRVHPTGGSDYLLLVRQGGSDLRTSLGSRGFTPRQADVAEQLLVGGTNDDIARRLAISTGTVRKHLEVLYRGLGVHDRSSAIAQIACHAKLGGAV